MEEIIQLQKKNIATIFNDKLLPFFIHKIIAHNDAMLGIEQLQKKMISKSFTKKEEAIAIFALKEYKVELEKLVSEYFLSLNKETDFVGYNNYYTSLDNHLETVDHIVERPQDRERFFSIETDSKLLKFRKGLKRLLFNVSKIPLKTANIFRKTKKEFGYWNQNIPFKNATQYYFKGVLINDLTPVFNQIYKEVSEITSIYWLIDQKIDETIEQFLFNNDDLHFSKELLDNLNTIPKLENRIENYTKALLDVYEATTLKYTNALYKSDTIELSANFFSTSKINHYQKKIVEKSNKNEKLWQNTYTVFKSDWELNIEIFIVVFSLILEKGKIESSIDGGVKVILEDVNGIRKYIETTKKTILAAETDKEIESVIGKELKNLNSSFKRQVKKVTNTITNQELSSLINQFEENALLLLKNISTKRAISSDIDYTSTTDVSSINYISPLELISYESWPLLAGKIKESKIALSLKVNSFIEDINALIQVSEFNLESALSLFENASKENTPKQVALEGIDRSIEKVEELESTLDNFNANNSEIIDDGIQKFNKSILGLTDTENIIQIRLTIAKAKSIEKSKLLKEKVIRTIKNFIPIAILFVKTKYNALSSAVKTILLRTGLYRLPSDITTDLADFLRQAEKALDALPYVYQRLFRSETLQNEELFVGRLQEMQVLEEALSHFNNRQYASTLIIGERGSGKTSLIHYFLNQKNIFKKTVFISPKENCSTTVAFITFLNTSFSKDFETLEQWIDFFKKGKKRIIVLEGLHYLYFRKVNGFKGLHQLSTLITATKDKVFWIVTSSKYAFEYLHKSIEISEIFAHSVEINKIDKKIMVEALLKRHKISGYNLFFEYPPKEYLTNNFLKSPMAIQQESLQEDFFSDINKIAQSNFKIACMYWICAAVKVDGSTIYMKSLKSINTSFLNKTIPVKLLLLNSILLHEKLTMSQISELSSLDNQRTENIVHSMYENGLLTIDNDGFYTINILLFRQITTLLKSKNLIH